jgi:hypothetical protein
MSIQAINHTVDASFCKASQQQQYTYAFFQAKTNFLQKRLHFNQIDYFCGVFRVGYG